MQKIIPFLWFDTQAEEAANFYAAIFKNAKVGLTTKYSEESSAASGRPAGSVMTIAFQIEGYNFTAINGGPAFKINPSVSFFFYSKDESEIDTLWKNLSDGGTALMELDKYDWSKKYGWVQDKFGVSWQLMLVENDIRQKIVPSFMFTNNSGKAEEAINFYTSVFEDAQPGAVFKYEPGQKPDEDSSVAYADFTLEGQLFAAMDGGHMHNFSFNEAISFLINCRDQKELDHYWNKLSAVPEAEMCGWLKDKFGISWQVVPAVLPQLLTDGEKSQRVMQKVLQSKKLNIAELEEA